MRKQGIINHKRKIHKIKLAHASLLINYINTVAPTNPDYIYKEKGGWMHHLFIYLFICRSCRMAALMLCYHSIVLCTCKDDISASDICHLYRFILVKYLGMPE